MEIGPLIAPDGSDRFSTSDEVRAALCCFPDFVLESSTEGSSWEVDLDLGGRVRVQLEDVEVLSLLESLDPTAN
jgi:hypothetical protein